MTKKIMTVTGPISPYELGHCQCHEHIMLKKGASYEVNPALCIDDFDKSKAEVLSYAAAGGVSLIDAQPGGCCRMERELTKISSDTGVHIIASAGFHKLCFYPPNHWIHTISQDSMYEFLLHEISKGMFPDIDDAPPAYCIPQRAGILKCAYDKAEFSQGYKKLWKAAARVQRETHVPLMIHMEQGVSSAKLLEFLKREGISLNQVILCHLDRTLLPVSEYLILLKQGVFLEFDTIGRFKYHDDLRETACIRNLIDAGYQKQLLLSLDTTRERLKAYNPQGIGLAYLFTCFIPRLKASGFSQKEILQLTVENCKSIFL